MGSLMKSHSFMREVVKMGAVAYEQAVAAETLHWSEMPTRTWKSSEIVPMKETLQEELKRDIGSYIKALRALEQLDWYENPRVYAKNYARLYGKIAMYVQALDEYCVTGELREDFDTWSDFNREFIGQGCEPTITDDLVGILSTYNVVQASA